MKITYIHQYFNTPSMSGGTRSYEMARRLVSMGHQVNIITSWRESSHSGEWFVTEESGITVHWLPIPYSNKLNYLNRIIAFVKFAISSSFRAVFLKSDVIFATSTPLTVGIPAFVTSLIRNVPLVFEVRDLWPEVPIALGVISNPMLIFAARFFERWIYRNSKFVIALSPGMKQGVVRTGYPSHQVIVIPNSCDNDLFIADNVSTRKFRSSRKWLKDSPLLIYAGTFGQINGVGFFVQLARELLYLNSDIKILLVGDGMKKKSVVSDSMIDGVFNNNLFFEDSMPKEDMPALFSASTLSSCVFIDLPEMQNNSANKFFDSLAAGKPIFINFGGWIHDLVIKHDCGISGWRRNIGDVALDLDQCMHDTYWLEQASRSSRRLAESLFDRDVLAHQLEKVLTAAAQSSQLKL